MKTFTLHWNSIWHWLIEPSATITQPEYRRRVRLFSGVLLPIIISITLGGIFAPSTEERAILGIAACVFLILYVLSRTKYYKVAEIITVCISFVIPFMLTFLINAEEQAYRPIPPLSWLCMAILMGSLWLSLKGLLVLFLAGIAGIIIVCLIGPVLMFPYVQVLFAFIASLTTLTFIAAIIQHQDREQINQQSRQLLASKVYITNIMNSMADILFVVNPDTTIQMVNQATLNLLGYEEQELIGAPIETIIVQEQGIIEWRKIEDIVKKDAVHNLESICLSKGEKKIPVFLSSAVMRDEAGKIQGIVCVAKDITERKRTEEALQNAKDAADAANRAKTEFLANISHELRTPLNGILGNTQILRQDPHLTESQRSKFGSIERSGKRLWNLIEEILDLSKIELQKMTLHASACVLPRLLAEITELVRIQAQEKGLAFHYETTSELPHVVQVDKRRLSQILRNLLSNAVKFTKCGGVTFKVGKLTHSEQIRFQVSDSGVGIPESLLNDIFSPFFQVADYTHKSSGLGLGLTITRKLLHLMGSELHVRSTVGEGTTFWFDINLPEANDDIIATTEPSRHIIGFSDLSTETFNSEPGEVPRQATRKILIVDDQDESRQVLKEILLPLGFDIIEAIDGKNALEKASKHHPDLVLMDLVMLRMDGYEVTHQIRQIPELKSTIVIAISADIYELSRQNCASVEYDDFLLKPIQIDTLLKKLQHYLKINWLYDSQQDV